MTEHSDKDQLKGEKVDLSLQFQVLGGGKVKAIELQTASHIHREERGGEYSHAYYRSACLFPLTHSRPRTSEMMSPAVGGFSHLN